MLTKTSKGYKTEALKSDAEYHTENQQSPQYVDIYDVAYVTLGRIIWQSGFNAPMYLILLKYNATNKKFTLFVQLLGCVWCDNI